MKMKRSIIASAIAATCVVGLVPVNAQEEQDVQILAEIVVTASKRARTLNDTPIAVSVVSRENIELANIQDLIGVQSLTPSLKINQQSTTSNTNFVIRGFGNGANNPGIEPSVGVFIDGVYRSRPGAALSDLPTVERVEVIHGPQSTLFGKNASAGIISVVTPAPSGERGGYVSATLGTENARIVKAKYEDAITDDLAFSMSAGINKRDGFFRNEARAEDINDRNRWQFRSQLQYNPSDETSLRIIVDADKIDESCCQVVNVVESRDTQFLNQVGGQIVPNDPAADTVFFDSPSTNEIENAGISIQLDHDFDAFTLSSITAFRNNQVFESQDPDFSSASLIEGFINETDIDTFTQEIRLTSNGAGSYDWLVGAFFFDESVNTQSDVIFGGNFRDFLELRLQDDTGISLTLDQVEALAGIAPGSFYQNGSGAFTTSKLDNQAVSLFGQLDFPMTDRLTATVGLNYTKDEKDFSIKQRLTEIRSSVELPAPFDGIPAVLTPLLDSDNGIEDPSTNDDQVTYLARLAWDFSDSLNMYATYATGFKASSINLSRDSAPTPTDFTRLQAAGLTIPNGVSGTRFAGQEDSTVVEIGAKALFDRGSFNVAVFDQEIDGLQSNIFLGTGFVLVNAGKAKVRGVELVGNWLASNALTLGVKATFLDNSVEEDASLGGVFDLDTAAAISDSSFSFTADYRFNLFGKDAYLRGDYQFVEATELLANVSTDIASSEINQLNLTAGMNFDNGLSVSLWGRNVTDDEFLWNIFPTPVQRDGLSGYRNAPATYGITVRKQF